MSANLLPWKRLSDLLDDSLSQEDSHGRFAPLDIVESESGYEVTLDLPGVLSDAVEIEFREGRLWVAGERAVSERAEGVKVHRLERRSGKFRRVIGMPDDVDSERIEATFSNGVLSVVIPKAQASKPKRIEIKTS